MKVHRFAVLIALASALAACGGARTTIKVV